MAENPKLFWGETRFPLGVAEFELRHIERPDEFAGLVVKMNLGHVLGCELWVVGYE